MLSYFTGCNSIGETDEETIAIEWQDNAKEYLLARYSIAVTIVFPMYGQLSVVKDQLNPKLHLP